MKMNKLFASVATAAVALSAIAPATIANAATGINGSTDLNDPNSNKVAEAANATTSGSATANSYASVNVVTDTLSLDKVPDFNFSPAVAGTEATLKNNLNESGEASDGNSNGILQITDSRKDDTNQGLGFNLTLGMGSMVGVKGTDVGPSDAFVLNLPDMKSDRSLTNGKAVDFKGQQIRTTADHSNDANVISAPKDEGVGNFVFDFQNTKGITMTVPDGVTKGNYSAPLTWTLTPITPNQAS